MPNGPFWLAISAEQCASNFWRDGHEEQVKCKSVHYRDAKNQELLWTILLSLLRRILVIAAAGCRLDKF